MTNFSTIKIEIIDRIAILSLNRPEKLNAMNFQMIHELIDCTKDISTNEEIKCLILRGEGKAFCSGADLSSGEKKWKDTEESLIKGYWPIFDNKLRPSNNVDNYFLYADLTNAQDTSDQFDIVSNGFKLRMTSNLANGSGDDYVYMAFAEHPFVSSKGVPVTAR